MQSITINDTPIEEKGLRLVSGAPSFVGLNRTREFVALPGRAGGLYSPISTMEPKVLRFEVVTGWAIVTDAGRATLLDELRDLFEGTVEVRYKTNTVRKVRGVARVFEGSVQSPALVNITTTIVIEVACENAAFMDVEPTQLVLGTTPVRVAVGTCGHDGRFYVTGANTTPFTITYRDMAGVTWGTLAITPALGTGERMIVDLASQQIVKVDSSDVRTLVPSWDTGSSWFHVLPRDCNREFGIMPTLESSVSTLYEYRCNWEF